MNKSDIIYSPDEGKHIFTEDEIKRCETCGECCQCGICCVAFRHKVPDKDPAVSPFEITPLQLNPLDVCPHLQETREGLFKCLVQDSKGSHSLLNDCYEWAGNQTKNLGFLRNCSRHDHMTSCYRRNVTGLKAFPEDVGVAEKFIKRGVIRGELIRGGLKAAMSIEAFAILKRCLGLPFLPQGFLDNIKAYEFFYDMPDQKIFSYLLSLGINPSSPTEKQKEFIKNNLPHL